MTPDFICVYDDAMSAELCEEIIAYFETCGQKVPGETGGGVNVAMKDSFDINITRAANWKTLHDRVMESVTEYMFEYIKQYPQLLIGALATGRRDPATGQSQRFTEEDLDDATIGRLMMKLYRPGEIIAQQYLRGVGGYHHWHSEVYPRDASCETLHRVLLFMYYLNTVEEGGETQFLFQERKIQPEQGRMVIAPAGFTHTHKGDVPISGDKFILTSWVLFNRAETIYR